ncbi:hypothetical protein SH1V18_31100 [Vallitalea longa]|uniref:Prepilin type IV endopeptidase peptidase domain-containing protein n=1 Tax=Vallitalea longa TaxID=2936439 RepID=A0A9W6DFI7_9FIRM|nr:prepilin peptidase [Vallitalea longa]GKX30630.1 hypothetical protein SH1V18_31100 [Vallitalea longa]
MILIIKYVLVLILLVVVLYTDTKSYVIKNSIILFFAIAGFTLNCIQLGFTGVINWTTGITVPIIVLFILFALRMLGAGDIKLIAVIGGLLGLDFLIRASLYMLIIAGGIALIKMIINRNLIIRFKHFFNYLHNNIINRQIGIYDELNKTDRSHVMRLSYAIGAGTIYQIFIDLKVFG